MEGPPPLRQNNPALYKIERETGSIPREKPSSTGILSTLAAIGVLIAKFFAPILKFLPLILKSGGTMMLSIGAYALLWGWKWAVGFVILIFIHECGHLVAAKRFGLKVGAPVFIPFMGAFIALKEAPRNAWIESWVGIGGPLLGSAGALACHLIGLQFDLPLLVGLAWTGYWLNLFNLIPVGQLDGGHVATALSPWLWVPGMAVMGYFTWQSYEAGRLNFIMILILLSAIPRLVSLFRKKTDEELRFYEITRGQRVTMGALYFGLIAVLGFAMHTADLQLREMGIINH